MSISDLRPRRDGRYLRVNDALCAMIGYSRAQLLTRTVLDVTHPADRAESAGTLQAAVNGELSSFRVEKRYVRADGSICWALASASVLRGADGIP